MPGSLRCIALLSAAVLVVTANDHIPHDILRHQDVAPYKRVDAYHADEPAPSYGDGGRYRDAEWRPTVQYSASYADEPPLAYQENTEIIYPAETEQYVTTETGHVHHYSHRAHHGDHRHHNHHGNHEHHKNHEHHEHQSYTRIYPVEPTATYTIHSAQPSWPQYTATMPAYSASEYSASAYAAHVPYIPKVEPEPAWPQYTATMPAYSASEYSASAYAAHVPYIPKVEPEPAWPQYTAVTVTSTPSSEYDSGSDDDDDGYDNENSSTAYDRLASPTSSPWGQHRYPSYPKGYVTANHARP